MQESIFTMALNPFFWKGMEYKKVLNIQDETEKWCLFDIDFNGKCKDFPS